jgi:hypothetical protein
MKPLKILLSLFISVSTLSLSAQDGEARAGLKGGLSLSNLISDNINDQNMRAAFNGGLFFKFPLSDNVAIQPEILYIGKGTTAMYDNFFSGDGEFTHRFEYLEVPILAVVNLTDNINIHAGPYFGYMLSASVENISENSDYNFTEQMNANDFNRFDYGVAGGIGFELDAIGFGVRYSLGMQEVGKDQSNTGLFPDESEESSEAFKDLRNSNVSLYLILSL